MTSDVLLTGFLNFYYYSRQMTVLMTVLLHCWRFYRTSFYYYYVRVFDNPTDNLFEEDNIAHSRVIQKMFEACVVSNNIPSSVLW